MSFSVKQQSLLRLSRHKRAYTVIFPDPKSPVGVRADLAAGMRARIATADYETVQNDFDSVPFYQRPIYNATWDPFNCEWGEPVARGESDFTMTPTAEYREVVYRCRPFWYKLETDGAGWLRSVSVAGEPLEGYRLAPMFRNGTDFVYRPTFEMTVDAAGLPHSRGGALPVQGTLSALMETVRLYDATARIESVRDWFSDLLLQMVEFAHMSPGMILKGRSESGLCATNTVAGVASASCHANAAGCFWRGKEHPWGNGHCAVWDLAAKRYTAQDGSTALRLYHLPSTARYTGAFTADYRPVGMLPVGEGGTTVAISGYGFDETGEILYPSIAAAQGESGKSHLLWSEGTSQEELCAILSGGNSSVSRIPQEYIRTPTDWEAVGLTSAYATCVGARLVPKEV